MAQTLAMPVAPSLSVICNGPNPSFSSKCLSFSVSTPPKICGLSIKCVRVGNVEIPNNKRVEYSLQYIHGIGRSTARKILGDLNIANKITKDLSEEELITVRDQISKYMIEGDKKKDMLAIFHKAFAHPPEELHSPSSYNGTKRPKLPEETLNEFLSHHPHKTFSMTFGDAAVLAYVLPDRPYSLHQRLFCGFEDIYCLFLGSLKNLCSLNKQYGLSKGTNEAMFVIEAYRTLRDRGPYPADQVVKDFEGSFAFVVYDSKAGTVFAALGSDGEVKLYWGIAADGSVVISDDLEVIKAGCAKSYAPFPTGCMFHSGGGGLMSFEHPMNKMKAMPRVDSEGAMCGASFKVDKYTRVNSIPRVGSEANWSLSDSQ